MALALMILTDIHISKQIAIQLRAKGVDVVRLEELEDLPNDALDDEILAYASVHQRAVISLDDDFRTLHYQWIAESKTHYGIFLGNERLQGVIGTVVNFIMSHADYIDDMDLLENELIEFR